VTDQGSDEQVIIEPAVTELELAQQAEIALSCPMGEELCVVIDQAQKLREELAIMAELVRTDTLTGLYNFRHFQSSLAREMERTRRTHQTTALLMVDLDFFKRVNDNWGHEVGNLALKSTADTLRNITRQLDIPCRYGGEEFAIILPATDLLTAIQVAERIRLQIESTPLLIEGKKLELTASLGVEVYTALHDDSPEQLVARADDRLYQAKQQGRNRVCHGGADMGNAAAAVSKEERDILSSFFGEDP
jgi:diguanylate cyclase (GGDEF)-like protein